ncbi:MAG: RNase adapter RapZ [Actinomycetota bacterium]
MVIAGVSGAGRSSAADNLEDMGWFVIDNLPPRLIPSVADLAQGTGGDYERVALAVGTTTDLDVVLPSIAKLRTAEARVRILFLDASTEILVRRYESTRRRHPLTAEGGTLAGAIEAERALLEPVKAEADVIVDTTELNVHQLRDRVRELFDDDEGDGMAVRVESFGYKHGLPLDVDLVFDCRFLPNPYWEEELRESTGLDEPVRDFVLGKDEAARFLAGLEGLLDPLLPAYETEGKAYLTIAFGCTGGHHRSVAIAEAMAEWLRERDYTPTVTHRDIDR